MTPRVLGLDLSITGTGIAPATGSTSTLHPRTAGDERLLEIRNHISLELDTVHLAVIEGPVLRSQAALSLAMLHGAVRTLLWDTATGYVIIPPATLKKYATGRGNATKPDMAVALYKRTGLELADDNQVDAWWLRAMGLDALGAPIVALPADQRAVLAKFHWDIGAAA